MTYDPQNAPLEWTEVLRREIDVDGIEMVLLQDQDGEQYWTDEDR